MSKPAQPLAAARRTRFLDLAPEVADFRDAVLDGLSGSPRRIPCCFFYDAEGSRLFDRITDLPEYYPTRTEIGILERDGEEMAELIGPGAQIVELGSGSSVKVRLLLDRLADPAAYVGIDISREHLVTACDRLAADYPGLEVLALCADYHHDVAVPPPASGRSARRVAFFPGSTIGNFQPSEAQAFFARWRKLLPGGGMLIGVDLKKDPAILNAAYDDAAGVTAAFNMNLLVRINRELGGNFELAGFRHHAFYNSGAGRVEMHLLSQRDQIVTVAGQRFAFTAGETIHTENSYKYTVPEVRALAARAGFVHRKVWMDPDRLFSVHYLDA